MVALKTLATNVRLALQQAHSAWTLMDQQAGKQKEATQTALARATTELRDALSITFADRKLASYFREAVAAKQPHLGSLLIGYKQEVEKLATWMELHPDEATHKEVQNHKKTLEHLIEDGRKSLPALYNNLMALDGLLREAKKEGLPPPPESLDQVPGKWLAYLESIEYAISTSGNSGSWYQRFGRSGTSPLVKEAKIIEKRSREGFPTIMLHAKQSLTQQGRIHAQQKTVQDLIAEAVKRLSVTREYAERLADLRGMGEEGYVLAHADERSASELAQCLDQSVVGVTASNAWNKYQRMRTHENHIITITNTLQDWTEELTRVEKQIEFDEKRNRQSEKSEKAFECLHEACSCVRRAVSTVHQWIEALNNAQDSTEGLLDSTLTDAHMSNVMLKNRHAVTESLNTYTLG